MTYATKYIGLPYRAGLFDCWGLVRKVYKEEYGINLQEIPIDVENLRQLITAIEQTPERNNWKRVTIPNEGDIVLMRQSRHPIHVGIWLNADGGGIMHCIKNSGVVFQDLNNLILSGWKIEGFYKYAKSHNPS